MQAARDLTLLGPPNEEQERKRRRISAMLASKLARTVQSIQRQERIGLAVDGGSSSGMEQSASGAVASSTMTSARQAAAGPGAPATPAASIYRQRPHKRSWADLADELPVVVRMPGVAGEFGGSGRGGTLRPGGSGGPNPAAGHS